MSATEFRAVVDDVGGGAVTLIVDRDTMEYPPIGAHVRVVLSAEVHAPWTLEQAASLNERQRRTDLHPYTCPKHSGVRLVAHQNGWWCGNVGCDYRQRWAHRADLYGGIEASL